METPGPTTPAAAADLLGTHAAITSEVRSADVIRRNLYLIWAAVAVVSVAPFDFVDVPWSVIALVIVIAAGLLLTVRELRNSQVINQQAMVSYTVVFATWSVWWVLMMLVVAPWLDGRIGLPWTVTGLLGTIPFLAGVAWEARR